MDDPLSGLAFALVISGIIGIAGAVILVRMGYGSRVIGAVSKGSRLAIKAVTRRFRRRGGMA